VFSFGFGKLLVFCLNIAFLSKAESQSPGVWLCLVGVLDSREASA
jgi:hypothetical protein